jgi:uncharacterized protein (TIGR00369 family)
MTRSRTITWEDPLATAAKVRGMNGLDAAMAGEIPPPPISQLLGTKLTKVEPGNVTMELPIGEYLYNPIGSVHGGVAATLLDSVLGCAVQSTLPQGRLYTTLELKISYLRPITEATGTVTAIGRVLTSGRKAAFAEGQITDASGKLLATASTTCAVWDMSSGL